MDMLIYYMTFADFLNIAVYGYSESVASVFIAYFIKKKSSVVSYGYQRAFGTHSGFILDGDMIVSNKPRCYEPTRILP